jgi:serine/threonine-protein kinase
MDEETDPRVGTVLHGRYRIVSRIGSGGMGVVYQGERLGLNRRVAIKFLHQTMADDPQWRGRFEREARAMSRLHHPHCVPVIDFGVTDAPYIVLEFVIGTSLGDLIARGPLPVRRAINITRQILAGLAHAHGQGVVHRDIKPDNVILIEATGTGDHAQLLDFGLARIVSDQGSVMRPPGQFAVGTPGYMSPEQAMGETVDEKSDVYSTGIVLFQMLTGVKPFVAVDPMAVLKMHVEQPPPKLADVAPPDRKFSPELEAIVAKALAKSASDRYESAMAFRDALSALASDPEVAPAPAPRAAPPDPLPLDAEPKKSRTGAVLTWLLLLVLAGGLGFAIYHLRQETQSPPPTRSSP